MRLQGKTALITGAARGIGLEMAVMMAQNGANVIVNTRNPETLALAAAQVRERTGQTKVGAFLADVGDKAQVEAMFDYAIENFGQVDVIVNNAAIAYAKPFLLYDDAWWNEMLRVNLNSVYYTCHRGVKEMIKKGVAGSIINFSSIGATKPHRQMLAYDTCKGAIESFTRALALEVAPWEIRVNAISPASILGFYVKEMDPEIAAKKDPKDFQTPIPRQGTPVDVANLAIFLASDESTYITGQIIPIDGGISVQARPYPFSKVAITPQNIKEMNLDL
jgi:NAD(P)-dependent dehydrogenase (short-subunit alcohol dehydrogenase family)